jgi:hypothetical protein
MRDQQPPAHAKPQPPRHLLGLDASDEELEAFLEAVNEEMPEAD